MNNCFEYNGKVYTLGTMVKIKYRNRIVDAYFAGNGTNGFVFKYNNTFFHANVNNIIEVYNDGHYNGFQKEKVVPKDREIFKLSIGWIWYILIMAILTIFNERILGWIFVSVIFFNWRKKVKEEESYYK